MRRKHTTRRDASRNRGVGIVLITFIARARIRQWLRPVIDAALSPRSDYGDLLDVSSRLVNARRQLAGYKISNPHSSRRESIRVGEW